MHYTDRYDPNNLSTWCGCATNQTTGEDWFRAFGWRAGYKEGNLRPEQRVWSDASSSPTTISSNGGFPARFSLGYQAAKVSQVPAGELLLRCSAEVAAYMWAIGMLYPDNAFGRGRGVLCQEIDGVRVAELQQVVIEVRPNSRAIPVEFTVQIFEHLSLGFMISRNDPDEIVRRTAEATPLQREYLRYDGYVVGSGPPAPRAMTYR